MEDKTVTLPEQCKRTLDYIKEYGYITRLEAFADLGIANLTSVIHILRSRYGYNIRTKRVESVNRYGKQVCYAQYFLDKE